MTISEKDQNIIWHPYTQMLNAGPPIAIVRGEGAWLFDEKGKKYLDAISSWWVNIHGHSHPHIAKRVFEQLNTLEHVIFAGFTHRPAVELAENLLKILPQNQSRIFYSDNGSTAVEVAVKMAVQYWGNKGLGKNRILAFDHAYHGDTFGAMSVSSRSSFTRPFENMLFEVIRLPFPEAGQEEKTLAACEELIKDSGETIAAFIFEPLVLGAGGMLMYDAPVLDALIRLCRRHSILIIADEVMTGFGRTGKLFASEWLAEMPDMLCLSKGITGGTMALGVTSCSAEIFNAFLSGDRSKTFFHGHSYTANPVACAAALASYELLTKPVNMEQIRRISQRHEAFIEKNKDNKLFTNLRSRGTILAMEITSREETSYFHSLRDKMYEYFLGKGVLLRPLGNTVYMMPPYCIREEELDHCYDIMEGLQRIL